MTMMQEIEQALEGSILRVKFEGLKGGETNKLNMTEYFFRFYIPPDRCIKFVQFIFSDDLLKKLESIAIRNGFILRGEGSSGFVFFRIKKNPE